jgi:hypothetical protein
VKFLKTDLPHVTKDQNTLVRLAQQIPNPVLASAVRVDVSTKLLVGLGCGEAVESHRRIPTAAPAQYAYLHTFSVGTHRWLARFGISV